MYMLEVLPLRQLELLSFIYDCLELAWFSKITEVASCNSGRWMKILQRILRDARPVCVVKYL